MHSTGMLYIRTCHDIDFHHALLFLDSYNELNAAMDLVLFEDAMSHICRINRILESPRYAH